jgi:hypothetical protein
MALPTLHSSRTSMPLARTQPRLLILIRKIQRVDKPPQQQPMILNDLQQRIRPRLPAITRLHQRRRPKLSLKQHDLISRSSSLTQIAISPAFNKNVAVTESHSCLPAVSRPSGGFGDSSGIPLLPTGIGILP